ncbi:MAG: 30S ribosomal protein S10 [Patescibacteria group bacterium]|nr:30S ribosomal protein S10 [Patescibacteria group bacterium]
MVASKDSIRIKLKSYDHKLIDQSAKMIIEAAERSGASVTGPIPLPVKTEKFTILRSTFVNKKSRLQYERRTHKRLIDLSGTTAKTVDALSRLSLPAGVGLEIKM